MLISSCAKALHLIYLLMHALSYVYNDWSFHFKASKHKISQK